MTAFNGALIWVVTEHSEAGSTTVGVFETIEEARDVVSRFGRERLEEYGIEGHVIGEGKLEPQPWRVILTREGGMVTVAPFIGCSCSDDEDEYYKHSFIEKGGDRMHVMTFAATPGQALAAAREYLQWLHDTDAWRTDERVPLHPIQARTEIPVPPGI